MAKIYMVSVEKKVTANQKIKYFDAIHGPPNAPEAAWKKIELNIIDAPVKSQKTPFALIPEKA